jgi:hypothetical protein
MNRRNIFTLSAITALGLAAMPGIAPAQQKSLKEQIVGTWALVSAETISSNGSKVQSFGPNPKGMLIFEASGRYMQLNLSSTLPKFASRNRMTGTADENKAVVQGSVGHYGTWTVDEAAKTVTQHLDAGTSAFQDGDDQKRPITTLTSDDLVLTNPVSGAGGGSTVFAFKRVK